MGLGCMSVMRQSRRRARRTLLHVRPLESGYVGIRAQAVAEFYGASRMIIIYTIAGAAGFTASTLGGRYLGFIPGLRTAGYTVGASAAICGLLGALLYYGRRSGSKLVGEQAKSWAIG